MKTLTGMITSYPKKTMTRVSFKLTDKDDEQYELMADSALLVRKFDTLTAECMLDNQKWVIVGKPLVLINKTKDHILDFIKTSLKATYKEAHQVLNQLTDNPFEHLSQLAELYYTSHDVKYLIQLGQHNQQFDKLGNLLIEWHYHVSLRQLFLIGLTKADIRRSGYDIQTLTKICFTNPLLLYFLKSSKITDIIDLLELKLSKTDYQIGKLLQHLYNSLSDGEHTCLPLSSIQSLIKNVDLTIYPVVVDLDCIYLKPQHQMEIKVAEFITNLIITDPIRSQLPNYIRYPAKFQLPTLTDEQKTAIQAALDHRLCIITSAAGCGKSTIIGEIVHNLKLRRLNHFITSFTGKATERLRSMMEEPIVPNRLATMHKLIHIQPNIAMYNYHVVVIDEISMVPLELFYNFIKAFPKIQQWILVGDENQLPPIGYGSVFQQLLKIKEIPTYTLTHNLRIAQDDSDMIMKNLDRLLKCKHDNEPFKFMESNNVEVMVGGYPTVFNLLKQYSEAGFTPDDVMVITPYTAHLDHINQLAQSIFNPTGNEHRYFNQIFRVGDPVVLKKNINKKKIYNGQRGYIKQISGASMWVQFGGSLIDFELRRQKKEDESEEDDEPTIDKLTLGYCLTVHRMQGGECNSIIFYVDGVANSRFLTNNLIYTALSRAKEMLHIVSPQPSVICSAIKRSVAQRHENLSRRIKNLLP
jgi:hypothetical protein